MSSPPVFDRLSALAEPVRARLLRVLGRDELAVGELARVLQTSQPTVSRHLKQLSQGGWVEHRKVGTASWYRLSSELPADSARLWALVREDLEQDSDQPGSLLAEDLRRLEAVLSQREEADSTTFFRTHGSRWDAVRDEQFGTAWLLPTLLSLLPPGLVVADLGCGSGALLPVLAPHCARLIGIDREAAMLELARQRTEGLPQVELCQALLDDLPLQAASVDLALCTLVLHHLREPRPVLAEVARVLVPDGRLVLLDMVAHDREDFRRSMGHAHRGFSQGDLAELCAAAGLHLRQYTLLPPDPAAQGPGLFVATVTRRS